MPRISMGGRDHHRGFFGRRGVPSSFSFSGGSLVSKFVCNEHIAEDGGPELAVEPDGVLEPETEFAVELERAVDTAST